MFDRLKTVPTTYKTEAVFGLGWDPRASTLTVRLHSRGVPFDHPLEVRHALSPGSESDCLESDPALGPLQGALAPVRAR